MMVVIRNKFLLRLLGFEPIKDHPRPPVLWLTPKAFVQWVWKARVLRRPVTMYRDRVEFRRPGDGGVPFNEFVDANDGRFGTWF